MIPPRKVKIPERKKTNVDLVIHCSKCGHGKIFKGVAGVDYSNIAKLVVLLNAAGWQCMPDTLCRSCACPMDADEFLEYRSINLFESWQIEKQMPLFRKKMHEKYGWKIERFFATTE